MGRGNENFVTDSAGRKRAVIVPIARYRRMMEDMHDLRVFAERRNETSISLDELQRRLRRDGLL